MNHIHKSFLLTCILAVSFLFSTLIPIEQTSAQPAWEQKADKVISVAKANLNKKYKAGGTGPNEFDCSGFTKYVYKKAINLDLPRTSRDQATVGTTVSKSNIRKGDLLFFKTNGQNISHVAIYMGNGKMIHARNERHNITIDNINDSYWKRTYVHAKRVIR